MRSFLNGVNEAIKLQSHATVDPSSPEEEFQHRLENITIGLGETNHTLHDFVDRNETDREMQPTKTMKHSIIIPDSEINDMVELVLSHQTSSVSIDPLDTLSTSPKQIRSENTLSEPPKLKSMYDRNKDKNSLISRARALKQYLLTNNLIKDRKWHFTSYQQCFVSKDIIPIILKLNLVPLSDNKSENERRAVEFGNQLIKAHIIQDVTKGHRFKKGYFFYEFVENNKLTMENEGSNRPYLKKYRRSKQYKHTKKTSKMQRKSLLPNDVLSTINNQTHKTHKYALKKASTANKLIYETDITVEDHMKDESCVNKIKFYFESFLVVHAWIYGLGLLMYQIGTRALLIVDMVTDILIALELYTGNEKIWFMLSSLFICLPFALVWSASLRFIQTFVGHLFNKLLHRSFGHRVLKFFINAILILYMFPPIGMLCIVLYEVYFTVAEVVIGLRAFIFGEGLILAADRQTKAMRIYRKAIEIFAESVPQTLLQLYIFINFKYLDSEMSSTKYGINENDLYMSIGVSLLNLVVHFIEFYNEAQLHGMLFSEYALSVLQLAEVPIAKFVPRLPAIKKGYVENVNFCGFQFDRASVTPFLEALHSKNCKLKTIKISIGSLSKLDLSSCKMLGYLLRNANTNNNSKKEDSIQVIISRVSSLMGVQRLFESFDREKRGYLNIDDFMLLLKKLKSPMQYQSETKQRHVFQKLAIRRRKRRDRIYFYDFFHKTADLKCEDRKNKNFAFDVTQIDYPLHFIFQRIKQSIDVIVDNEGIVPKNTAIFDKYKEKQMVENMGKLFHFCQGLNIVAQIEETLQQHVFYTIIDALYAIDLIPPKKKGSIVNQYDKLLWLFFLNLLSENSSSFDTQLFLHRNNMFEQILNFDLNERIQSLETSDFINDLNDIAGHSGYNIFEFCFLYKNYKRNKCRAFVYLLDAFLQSVKVDNKLNIDTNYLHTLIWAKTGDLSMLFEGTNGFYIRDRNEKTPLYYAVRNGMEDVVEFFVEYIMMDDTPNWSLTHGASSVNKHSPLPHLNVLRLNSLSKSNKILSKYESKSNVLRLSPLSKSNPFRYSNSGNDSLPKSKVNCAWIHNQDYLHSILHALFLTKAVNPNPDILVLLLETEKININYCCDKYGGYLGHNLLRYRAGKNQKDKGYLLKCLQILDSYEYDFVNNKSEPSHGNILHCAALLGDLECIQMILTQLNNGEQRLLSLLNAHNKHRKMPIHIALELNRSKIVETLLECTHQSTDNIFEYFIHSLTFESESESDCKWLKCVSELIRSSKGKMLAQFSDKQKEALLWHTKAMFDAMDTIEFVQSIQALETPLSPDTCGKIAQSEGNSAEERYKCLETIVMHLHKSLHIPMTRKRKIRDSVQQMGTNLSLPSQFTKRIAMH